jgi:hypothetical protein
LCLFFTKKIGELILSVGQGDVLDCLKDNCWKSRKELESLLPNINAQGINESLRRLAHGGFIEIKKDTTKRYGYLYRLKEFKEDID